jgi:hypothetical protein
MKPIKTLIQTQRSMKYKSTTTRILWQSACAAVFAGVAGAETIAFVASFTNASYTADTIALLESAGHTVTVVPAGDVSGLLSQTHTASGLTRKAYLETFNMVLISRASSSGDYTDKAGWAAIEVPVISMNAYAVRSSRLGWFSAEQSDQGPADPDTIVTLPTHPIWTNVTLTETDTRANLFVPMNGNNVTGVLGTFGSGDLLGTSTGGTNVATIVAWEDGDLLANTFSAGDRRVFFATGGYANFPVDDTLMGSNTAPLTAAGDIAFLNAVAWALTDNPNPDSDNDGLLDVWEINYFGDLTTARGTQAQDPSLGAQWDNDGDGFSNEAEETANSNPKVLASVPGDADGDTFADADEITYFGNLNQLPTGDFDGDYATNITEINAGVSPTNANLWPDTDADLMSDGWETTHGLIVGTDDSALHGDADGFTNLEEFKAGTDPKNTEWSPKNAILAHRWSFNGNLTDSAGNSNARILNDDTTNIGGSSDLSNGTGVELGGGAKATSDYILLGNNLLSNLQVGGVKPVTIELWATQHLIQAWSRIWAFGTDVNGDPGTNGSLRMTWTVGTDINNDGVAWQGNGDTAIGVQNNAPYVQEKPFHILMTIVPAVFTNGAITQGTTVTWYSAPVPDSQAGGHPLSGAQGTFNTTANLSSLLDSVCYLGRSMWPDATANATYDEVRIWKGALTETERELFHLVGPNNIDRSDADNDGFPDAWETARFGNTTTATAGVDTDLDLANDEIELLNESNPNDLESTVADSDKDGLGDAWELQYFNNLLQIGTDDADLDLVTNEEEETYGTNPADPNSSPDTDGDGIADGWELTWFSDLATADSTLRVGGVNTNSDGDFDNDREEYVGGFDPTNKFSGRDTDADLLADYWEFFYFEPTIGANYLVTITGTGDQDLDTATNREEFVDGTDPTNPTDVLDSNGDGIYDGTLLLATDAINTSSFNAGTNWTGALAPVANKNYLVPNGLRIRTPNLAATSLTFLGRTLALSGELALKGDNSTFNADYVFAGGSSITQAQGIINIVDAGGTGTIGGTVKFVTDSVLTAQNGPLAISALVSGSGALNLVGPNAIQFDNPANTYSGNITMGSTARLVVNGVLNSGTGSVFNFVPGLTGVGNSITGTGTFGMAGTMNIDLSGADTTAGSNWNLVTTASVNYDPSFTVTGSGFTPDAGAVGSRVWTSGDGLYRFTESTGILRYGLPGVGFAGWAGDNGLTAGVNDGVNENPDQDNYDNLLEYQLGGDPLDSENDLVQTSVDATHLIFTFERSDPSEADSALAFQWSTGLGTWNSVLIGATGATDSNGVEVTVGEDLGASGVAYDAITVKVPKSLAPTGRLFGRLQGTQP